MTQTPHFDLPFRFGSDGHPVTVEQDSVADVSNCVSAILRTFKGERVELPDFGINDPTFTNQPIKTAELIAEITDQEPRAISVMDQHPNTLDQLVAEVTERVSTYPEVQRA